MHACVNSCNRDGGLINSPEGSCKRVVQRRTSPHRKLDDFADCGDELLAYEGLTSKGLVANKICSYAEREPYSQQGTELAGFLGGTVATSPMCVITMQAVDYFPNGPLFVRATLRGVN